VSDIQRTANPYFVKTPKSELAI